MPPLLPVSPAKRIGQYALRVLMHRLMYFLLFVRRSLIRLANRIVPSALPLYEMTTGVAQTQILAVFAELGIASYVVSGTRSLASLSEATNIDEAILRRFLRVACAMGLIRLGRKNTYRPTALTYALIEEAPKSMANFARYMASSSNVGAWSNLLEVLQTQRDAFALRGTSVWDRFNQNDSEGEQFSRAMTDLARMDAPHIARSYPFERHKTVCDIGGGKGTLIKTLLRAHDHLDGIVIDQPSVIDGAFAPRGLEGRMRFVSGNFFDEIVTNADVYLMRQILHDWSDDDCIRILKNTRRVLDGDKRLLVIDSQVEEQEYNFFGAIKDLTMAVVCGGKERSLGDMFSLFEQSGLRVVKRWLTQSPVVIWEAKATESRLS